MSRLMPPNAPPLQPGFQPGMTSHKVQKPKSSALTTIFGVISIIVLVLVFGTIAWSVKEASRSGIIVDGEEMSKADAKGAMREVREMMTASQAPDPTKIPLIATYPLSKKYKAFIESINNSEKTLAEFNKESKLETAMEASFSTKAERDLARNEAKRYDAAIGKYFDDEIKTLKGLQDFLRSALKNEKNIAVNQIPRMEGLKVSYAKISKARLDLLDFLDRVPPTTQGKEKYLFYNSTDVKEFNLRTKAVLDAGEEYDKLYKSGQQRVDADFGSAMDALHDL